MSTKIATDYFATLPPDNIGTFSKELLHVLQIEKHKQPKILFK